MKKIIAFTLALVLVLALAACGNSPATPGSDKPADTNAPAPAVKGEQQSWGLISVLVPEGYVLSGGSITGVDDTDETQCAIQPETPSMYDYYWICVQDAETAAANIEMTKSMNNAEDITVNDGSRDWTGCHYTYDAYSGKVDCGAISCVIGDATYVVNFCGHAPDSAEMIAVLASVSAAK